MSFWIVSTLIALGLTAIIARVLLQTQTVSGDVSGAAHDMQVYRDQLRELERDVARGTLPESEAERARIEISRRLLEADRKAQASDAGQAAPRAATLSMVALVGALIIGGGYFTYYELGANRIGRPLYPDMGLKARIESAEALRSSRQSQEAAEVEAGPWTGPAPEVPADYLELIADLRAAVAAHPDDLEGHRLLSEHEAKLGNYVAAHKAKARVIALQGHDSEAYDYSEHAELMIRAAGGYVSPEAEEALTKALQLDPKHPVARYFVGLNFAQIGRPDLAFNTWRNLLEESRPGAPWVAPIRGQIMQLAALAGVDYTLPAGSLPPAAPPTTAPLAGGELGRPSAEDMAAAAEMSEEDRSAMIQGMVTQLSERLATHGGTAQEWAQLVGALGVLGEMERATAIWQEAQQVFAEVPDQLALIDAAAERAGLEAQMAPVEQPQASEAELANLRELDNRATNLADTLATRGGTPEQWAELIGLYTEMGEVNRARSTWQQAQTVFPALSQGRGIVLKAAQDAGLEP
jgi:cytochrome c-type biogenesis protein CcmH